MSMRDDASFDRLYDKTDNLSSSHEGFRRGANRVRKGKSTWIGILGAVTQKASVLSTESQKAIQGMSTYLYNAGNSMVLGSLDITEENNAELVDEKDDEMSGKDIVGNLLAEWTTLPPTVTSSTSWRSET